MVIEREDACDAFSSVQGLVPENEEPRKKGKKLTQNRQNDKVEIWVLM